METGEIFRKDFMKIKEGLSNIVFPPRCPVCDEVIYVGKDTCEDCRKKVVCIGEPSCKKCGKPLEDQRREYCTDCMRKKHYFSQGKAVFVYQGEIRQSMYRFKYSNKREYADFYAKEAVRIYGDWIRRKQIEAIVPVPMYRWKEKGRGYNQAAVFAQTLGEKMNLPVEKRMVKRIRNTTPQKELNDVERKINLKKAFQLVPNIVKYRKILIVDDIYTTGSTIDAVAEVLLQAGVDEIYFLCISIGEGLRNCKGCGKLFNYMSGAQLCPECRAKLEKKFSSVKDYIGEHPQASISQVAEDMDVSVKQIKQWVKEERLILSEASLDGVLCEHCGRPITSGRFCDKCKAAMANNLQSVLNRPRPMQQRSGGERDEGDKMRFLR